MVFGDPKAPEQKYGETTLREAQKFTKTITEDELGRLFYQAYKVAPAPMAEPVVSKAASAAKMADQHGTANLTLHKLALALSEKIGLSHEKAYVKILMDPKYATVAARAKNEDLVRVHKEIYGGGFFATDPYSGSTPMDVVSGSDDRAFLSEALRLESGRAVGPQKR